MTEYEIELSEKVNSKEVKKNEIEFGKIENVVADIMKTAGVEAKYWEELKTIDISRMKEVAIIYGVNSEYTAIGLGGKVKLGEYRIKAVVKKFGTDIGNAFLSAINNAVNIYEKKGIIIAGGERIIFIRVDEESIEMTKIRGAIYIEIEFIIKTAVGI